MIAAATLDELRAVLRHYALVPDEVRDIRTARVNKHWRVACGETQYVVRRYHPARSASAIRCEHHVLTCAVANGWPVAAAIATRAGESFVEHLDARFALFPFLAGRPAAYGSPRRLREKGRLLAGLHRDLDHARVLGQREGFGRLTDVDAFAVPAASASFDDLLRQLGKTHPNEANIIAAQRRTCLRECARLGYQNLPDAVVHSDFHHDNILFQRGRLAAVLDFDLVHVDARVADIAVSIALDCLAKPDYNGVDPLAAAAFASGYASVTPLSQTELRLIAPLIRAQIVWLISWRLPQWAEGSEKALPSILRSVHERFPQFEARRQALEDAVRAAVLQPPARP